MTTTHERQVQAVLANKSLVERPHGAKWQGQLRLRLLDDEAPDLCPLLAVVSNIFDQTTVRLGTQ